MTNSQNGWPVSPAMTTLVVNGVTFGGVRTGDVFTVLRYVAERYDAEVGRLVAGQCGGYNPRSIAGSGTPSNHASATAIDINWTQNPEHKRTMTAAERSRCHAIVEACDGVVRWGGDYAGADVDEMHWEINKGAGPVAELARKIEATMDEQSIASKLGADLNTDASGIAKGIVRQVDRAAADNFGAVNARLEAVEAKLDRVLAALGGGGPTPSVTPPAS